MIRVLIDTSAFIANLIENEKYHDLVKDQYQTYRRHRAEFITTDYVYDELITRVRYDFGVDQMKEVMNLITRSLKRQDLTLLWTDKHIFQEAQTILARFSDHALSFTDATLCAYYKEAEIDDLFTLDQDFTKVGLKVRPLI